MKKHRKVTTAKEYNTLSSLNNSSGSESATIIEDKPQSKEGLMRQMHHEAIAFLIDSVETLKESLKENTKEINRLTSELNNHINEL